jgi:hypothetical protein
MARNYFKKHKIDILIPLIIVIIIGIFFGARSDVAESSHINLYPKVANFFLKTPITDSEAQELAQWDVVILGMQAQDVSPEQIRKIRSLNPQVKILAYVLSQELPVGTYESLESVNGPWHKLFQGFADSWWLYRSDGSYFSSWPGHRSVNVTNQAAVVDGRRWNTYLPQFMHDQVISTGLWDGIFYDNVWGSVSWVGDGNMDINRDNVKDEANWLNQEWQAGMRTMLAKSRELEGANKIILGNGGNEYKDYLNGRLIENAYLEIPWNGWLYTQKNYRDFMANGRDPKITIINNNTNGSGNKNDYQLMRYGLVSTLLDNGYYSFDCGITSHGEIWWYDEYDVDLGQPTSAAYNVNNNSTEIQTGFWRRNFEKGAVFVNSTGETKTILLGEEELERISGGQDPAANDGTRVNYVRLNGKDGIVLLRPLSEILGSTFVNGYFARIFDEDGNRLRGGFYTYKKEFPGSTQIIVIDVDRDGDLETIVASSNKVEIYSSNGIKEKNFYPYTEKYNQGINISVGDLNGDGTLEIITGTEKGGGPHIRVFNDQGKLINPGFFAYGTGYRGGVNVTVGDLNGDGTDEIIAGAGVSGGPHIRVFNRDGRLLSAGWFAYDKNFRGGVNVAAGDVNGDGKDEIVSAPGFGGKPEIKVWDSAGHQLGKSFMAFDESNRSGVKVIVNDVNRDGYLEILAASLNVF